MYTILILGLLLASSLPSIDGHIIGGDTKEVGNYTVSYKSIPSNPLPGSDVTLAFSILSGNADVSGVLAEITVMKEDELVVEVPERNYATGDISVPVVFPEDGSYIIIIEARAGEGREPIAAVFEQRVGAADLRSQITSADIDVGNALALSLAFGVVPLYIGLTNSRLSRKLGDTSKGFITSAAFGIVIFSLVDLFGGASGLGIDFGLRAVHLQATLVLAFAIGLAIPFLAERYSKKGGNAQLQVITYGTVYLFALAVAFHSFAEGVVVGYDLQSGYSFTFAQRSLQGTSFVLHKIAEGFVISIPVMLAMTGAKAGTERFVLAGIIGSIPLLVGVTFAYLGIPGLAASYGFALGAGAFTYVLFKLAHLSQILAGGRMRIYSGVMIGVLFMYLAGWIHSIQ